MKTKDSWADTGARARRYLRDGRVLSILAVSFAAALGTLFVLLKVDGSTDVGKFWGAVFAGWVGGLLLFLMVGLAVAVASFNRPEDDSFDSRARILFQRQSGRHIDYIVEQLGAGSILEPYSESVEKKIVVTEYYAQEGKFLISHETETVVRGYVDDMETAFPWQMAYSNAPLPPPGRAPSCISYILVNGDTSEEGLEFEGSFSHRFDSVIPKRGSCNVKIKLDVWVAEGSERNTHKTVRYTQKIALTVQNSVRRMPIKICLLGDDGHVTEHTLRPGQSRTLVNQSDIKPGHIVYDFSILPA